MCSTNGWAPLPVFIGHRQQGQMNYHLIVVHLDSKDIYAWGLYALKAFFFESFVQASYTISSKLLLTKSRILPPQGFTNCILEFCPIYASSSISLSRRSIVRRVLSVELWIRTHQTKCIIIYWLAYPFPWMLIHHRPGNSSGIVDLIFRLNGRPMRYLPLELLINYAI